MTDSPLSAETTEKYSPQTEEETCPEGCTMIEAFLPLAYISAPAERAMNVVVHIVIILFYKSQDILI